MSDPADSVRFARLDDANHGTWEIMMEAELIRKGLFEGIVEIMEEDATKYEEKKLKRSATKMAQARAEMILRVQPSQLAHMRSKDPMEIWQNLKKVHQARGFATNLALRRKFLTAKKRDDQLMQSWIGEIQTQSFLMEQAGMVVSDQDKILALTMGLPPSYNPVIINFDATPNDQLTFDHVIVRLLNEETRQSSDRDGSSPRELAMLARHSTRHSTRPLSEITCYNCQKKGHYQSHCPEKNNSTSSKDSTSATAATADADDIW